MLANTEPWRPVAKAEARLQKGGVRRIAEEKQAALETLRSLCEPIPDNVTPIRRKA